MYRFWALLGIVGCAGGDTSDTGLRTLDTCGGTAGEGLYAWFRCVDLAASADAVTIHTNSLPPHATAYYGLTDVNYAAWDDRGGDYFQNPNVLAAQDVTLTIPDVPVSKGLSVTEAMVDLTMGTSEEEYAGGPAGVALDGVLLYNATAAPGDDIRDEEFTFDNYNAHPSPDGAYHYHGASPGPLEVLLAESVVTTTIPGGADVEFYGVMCDGTVVLGCTELDGGEPSGELDAQGGHVHDVVNPDGVTVAAGRYHTHVCPGTYAEFTPEIQYYTTCTR